MVMMTDGVRKVETVCESVEAIGDDCCGFRIGLVTDCVRVSVSDCETEIVEAIEDIDENVDVLGVEDDIAESVNQAVVLQPNEEIVEAIEDIDENVDVLGVENDIAESVNPAVVLQPKEEIVEAIEDIDENVDVLGVENDTAESVNQAVVLQPKEEIVEAIEDIDENVDVLGVEDDAAESVNEAVAVSFPDTFLKLDLGIQFGSFGTEPACFVNNVKLGSSLIDLQELSDKSGNNEGVNGQRVGVSVHVQTEEVEFPSYCLLVKNPGYEDEKLNAQIEDVELQLDENRRRKDAIIDEIRIKWDNMLVHQEAFHAKNLELEAATHLVKSKRRHIDRVECVTNKIKNYAAVLDIDSKISKAEHIIKHGTLSAEDEKQFIHEIKQLKGVRAQLASNMGSPNQIQHMLDRKDQLEGLVRKLNMQLKTLKDKVSEGQVDSHTIRNRYFEELEMGRELWAQFIAAEESCKEASTRLHDLRKQLNDKVERFMAKWNTNEEFRNDYISQRDMVATQDAQDEPSCMLPSDSDLNVASESGPTPDEIEPSLAVADLETQEAVESFEEQRSYDQVKDNVSVEVEEMMITKEPIEHIEIIEIKEKDKTDELEEIEAKLKEKNLLEEKRLKEIEAQERKKQNDQKGPTRAEIKAQQEAQQQEKRRLKRSKKREKKRVAQERKRAARDAASSSSNTEDGVVAESNKSKEVENTNGNSSAVAVVNRNQKPWRHWGSMVITVVVLLLSIFSLLQ